MTYFLTYVILCALSIAFGACIKGYYCVLQRRLFVMRMCWYRYNFNVNNFQFWRNNINVER